MKSRLTGFSILALVVAFYSLSATRAAATTPTDGRIRTALIWYGGGPRDGGTVSQLLAQFDLIAIDRALVALFPPNTWRSTRQLNPSTIILTYQLGPQTATDHDTRPISQLNSIARYRFSSGRADGAIAPSHPEWILRTVFGNEIRLPDMKNYVQLDFGSEGFQQYWLAATVRDVLTQPWGLDGIMVDNCSVDPGGLLRTLAGRRPAKYPTGASWNTAMNSFVSAISSGLKAEKAIVMTNRGGSRTLEGLAAWTALDKMNAPDFAMEEGAFAVNYGPGDVQFYSVDEWLRQVSLTQVIKNSSVVYVSHTDIHPDSWGRDSKGVRVSFGNVFEFALGSYLLASSYGEKPSYFSFNAFRGKYGYSRIETFGLLKSLSLGLPKTGIEALTVSGGTVFQRTFSQGRVVVNPAAASVVLPNADKLFRITTDNGTNVSVSMVRGPINIAGHSSAILLNSAPPLTGISRP